MIYKTNWLRGLLGPMLVAITGAAFAVPANMSGFGLHTVFIDNGAVYGMGYNKHGEIAPGTATEFSTPFFTGILDAKSVATNYYRTVILKKDGSAIMTGRDSATNQPAIKNLPASNITDVAISFRDVFYISNQQLFKWTDGTEPVIIAEGVKNVAAGLDHIVVLFKDGTVGTMGGNARGQLGTGTTTTSVTIQQLGLANVVEIAAGENVSAVRTSSGDVYAFGSNSNNKFGLGSTADVLVPTKLSISEVARLLPGRSQMTVIKTDGSVWTAGWHNYIEGALYNVDSTFVRLPVGQVVDATVGTDFVVVDKGVVGQRGGWGGNIYGKLGLGDNIERHQLAISYFSPVAPPTIEETTSTQPMLPVSEVKKEDPVEAVDTAIANPLADEPAAQSNQVVEQPSVIEIVVDAVVKTVTKVVEAVKEIVTVIVGAVTAEKPAAPIQNPLPTATNKSGNNGWGNGDQAAPGKSGPRNNAENSVSRAAAELEKAELEYRDRQKMLDEAEAEYQAARKSNDKKKEREAQKKRDSAKQKRDDAKKARDDAKKKYDSEVRKSGD